MRINEKINNTNDKEELKKIYWDIQRDLNGIVLKKKTFKDLYNSIYEAIEDLKSIEEKCIQNEYLISFRKQLLDGKNLSNKQITQLKRLSKHLLQIKILDKLKVVKIL